MATKKRKSKKRRVGSHRRRRRMGAVHPAIADAGMMLAGAGLGALSAVFINQAVKTSFTTAPGYVGGLVPAVMGAALPMFVKPSPFVLGAAAGAAGAGIIFIANETFISLPGISGVPAMPGYINKTIGVYPNAPRIGGSFSGNASKTIGKIINR
jgi:hypothetical protein